MVSEEVTALIKGRDDGACTGELAMEMGHLSGHVPVNYKTLPAINLSRLNNTGIHLAISFCVNASFPSDCAFPHPGQPLAHKGVPRKCVLLCTDF